MDSRLTQTPTAASNPSNLASTTTASASSGSHGGNNLTKDERQNQLAIEQIEAKQRQILQRIEELTTEKQRLANLLETLNASDTGEESESPSDAE